jgi:ankyrin repeat protein
MVIGADINARDESYSTPLHHACNSINGGELVQLFLEHRADISPHDTSTRATPLHCACKQGAFGNAELLLKHNADPNAMDVHRNTPLHVASMLGYTGIAQLLIANRADANLLNAEGMTPAQLALNADD